MMIWNDHYRLRDMHSFLSPSSYHWINYSPEQLATRYANKQKAALGTKIHAFAEQAIRLVIRLPQNQVSLNAFVNDAIGYRMSPEVMLYYSTNSFGTADAIVYNSGLLRIHDLKTGKTPGHPLQLESYAALFCLEYDRKPNQIEIRLRIYQNDEVTEWSPASEDIMRIMDKITTFDKIIDVIKHEA